MGIAPNHIRGFPLRGLAKGASVCRNGYPGHGVRAVIWGATVAGPGGDRRNDRQPGPPCLRPETVPTTLAVGPAGLPQGVLMVADQTLAVAAAGMGNPHVVIPVADLDAVDLEALGPLLEQHEAFPARTNVHFVQVLSPDHLRMRVWERGAGPTLACGTGACATLVACHLLGLAERRARLDLPGGTLEIEWDGASGPVWMTGPAEAVFHGQLAHGAVPAESYPAGTDPAKTDPAEGAKGTSLIVVETDGAEGFQRGRNLHKIGMEGNDTSELFFNDVKVPGENIIGGGEGQGFIQLMQQLPQERLNIAIQGVAAAERGLQETLAYVKERKAFGKRVIDFQNTQFKLAEVKTKLTVAKVFVDHCMDRHLKGDLDAVTASMAKYWVTDIQGEVIDEMLQLHGGYGYMNEYPIAQLYKDARVQRIYGGTNEIMKLLIARTL